MNGEIEKEYCSECGIELSTLPEDIELRSGADICEDCYIKLWEEK
jgi:hypothetical protein